MPNRDMPLAQINDIAIGLGLLTRVPVRIDQETATGRGARAAWAWPLVGVVVGLAGGLTGWVATGLGASPEIAAGAVLVTLVMLTGAMHEDGLADSADGLWGGADPARRLEIMKDSRTGAYGVIALVLGLLLRWSALSSLIAAGGLILPLIAVAVLSRAPMTVLMAALPNARGAGLSDSVGRPGQDTTVLAVAVAAAIGFVLLGWAVLPVIFWIALASIAVAALAKARLGGQTGDILGAVQQVAEVAALAALASMLG